LLFRVEVVSAGAADILGMRVDLEHLKLRNKAKRAWRLRAGIYSLLRQGSASGYVMQVMGGHLINAGLFFRGYLSILSSIFVFVVRNMDRVASFDSFLRGELQTAAALVCTLEVSIRANVSNRAYMFDSSLKGFAVHFGIFSDAVLQPIIAVRERWKFKETRGGSAVAHAPQFAAAAAE
jgi:hypothetical protein